MRWPKLSEVRISAYKLRQNMDSLTLSLEYDSVDRCRCPFRHSVIF
jgi:hypothetical protein